MDFIYKEDSSFIYFFVLNSDIDYVSYIFNARRYCIELMEL